jgi:hypothetical protein
LKFGGKFHVTCLKARNGLVLTIRNETKGIKGNYPDIVNNFLGMVKI